MIFSPKIKIIPLMLIRFFLIGFPILLPILPVLIHKSPMHNQQDQHLQGQARRTSIHHHHLRHLLISCKQLLPIFNNHHHHSRILWRKLQSRPGRQAQINDLEKLVIYFRKQLVYVPSNTRKGTIHEVRNDSTKTMTNNPKKKKPLK